MESGKSNVFTPENWHEIIGKVNLTRPERDTFEVRGDLLLFFVICAQVVRNEQAENKGLQERYDAAYKPNRDVPAHYKKIGIADDGDAWENNGLRIIRSGEEIDGKRWVHVSFSRKSKMPSYDDMARVKRDFIGEHGKAIMVLPGARNHVNIHPFCLHLFHCEGDDGLPEFSWGGKSI